MNIKSCLTTSENEPVAVFAIISDLHIGSKDNLACFEKAITNAFKNGGATSLIVPGDLSDGNNNKKEIYEALKNNVPDIYHKNTMLTFGNHDIRWSGLSDNKIEPGFLAEYRKVITDCFNTKIYDGTNCFDKTIGDNYFICLNSDKGDKDEIHLNESSFLWLEQKISAYKKSSNEPEKPFFVIMHEPLRDTHWRSNLNIVESLTDQDARFKTLFAQNPQMVIISGHIHNGFGCIEFIQRPFGTLVDAPSLTRQENGDRSNPYEQGTGWLMKIYAKRLVFEAWNFAENMHDESFDQTILLPQLSVIASQLKSKQQLLSPDKKIQADTLISKAEKILELKYTNTTSSPGKQADYNVDKLFDKNKWKEIDELRVSLSSLLN